MPDDFGHRLEAGIRNLLVDCAGCSAGHRLLLVRETEGDGFYDPDLAPAVADAARRLGMETGILDVPLRREAAGPDPGLVARMRRADRTIFLARLGDQVRFEPRDASMSQVVSYALDRGMMASAFGTAPHRAFEELSRAIRDAFAAAGRIRVTCPAGTDFAGRVSACRGGSGDVTRKRFPLSVFAPLPAERFSGRIAQAGFLTGTGSHYYRPYACALNGTLLVDFDGNRITRFGGDPADVGAAEAHYAFVGRTFGIDAAYVHSWHVGIHPGCSYDRPASANFERWSGSAFGNPRLLHFHTCGAYAPGEISLNVLDPTILLDGVPLWDAGRLRPDLLPAGAELLDRYPEVRALFDDPSPFAGLGPDGRLSAE